MGILVIATFSVYVSCVCTQESTFQYPDMDTRKPPVPNHKEKPLMGTKTSRNFITTNAVNNILSVPRIPAPKYVDTPMGAKHTVEVRVAL